MAAGALPLFNIGCAGFGLSRARQIAKGAKIRVALIGCGLQTHAMIDGVLCEDLVAIVDPDPARFAWLDKYVADTCGAAERENYAKARRFSTYQDMFDRMGGEVDAIVVETPNHQHVLPAVMAMRRGIHVYLDKPLCLTAAECDLILAEARKNPGLVTQCGTYGHSFPSMKYCVDRIAEDWDLWCGGSPVCDFYPDSPDQDGMHPHGWHSWIGYGNGSIGNLGMHIMDVAFWALGLKDPDTVTCHEAKFALDGAWAYRDAFEFHYPTSKLGHEVTMHWWDGLNDGVPYTKEYVNKYGIPFKREHLNIPPKVLEVEKENGFEKDPFYKNGLLFVGTKGKLWFTHHGGYRFMPRSTGWCIPRVDRPDDFNYRLVTPKHFHEFYEAIRAGEQTIDNFEYSVPLAKTVCLGNISALAGKGSVLKWDGHRITNNEEANRHVGKEYRSGWNPFA